MTAYFYFADPIKLQGGGSTCIKKGWDSDLKHDKGGERPIK